MTRPAGTRDPLEYHDVMIAHSKAKAAWWLLSALDGD